MVERVRRVGVEIEFALVEAHAAARIVGEARERPLVHLGQREEGRPPGVSGLEIVDTALPDAVVVHDHVREAAAGRRLAGDRVLGIDAAELRDRAVNPV